MENALFPRVPPEARTLTSMPVTIQYYGSDQLANVSVTKVGDDVVLRQSFSNRVSRLSRDEEVHAIRDLFILGHDAAAKKSLSNQVPRRQADAYAIREAFFNIGSLPEAVAFLQRCGPFRADVHETTMSDIKGWQVSFRDWLIGGYNCFPLPPVIELSDTENDRIGGGLSWDICTYTMNNDPQFQRVQAMVHCDSAVEAIGATIALDLIAGANFKTCVWCTSLFEVTKDNGRQYCTMACAHRAGQKRRRAEAKILKDSVKPKKLKTKSTKGKA